MLRIRNAPNFLSVPKSTLSVFHETFNELQNECEGVSNDKFRKSFRNTFRRKSADFYRKSQWDAFITHHPEHALSQRRTEWYHDDLIHTIKHPYMRLVRKCRLGASELAAHCAFLQPSKTGICTHCDMGINETSHHFIFDCPAFSSQRSDYFRLVRPLLKSMSIGSITVSSCLGFHPSIRSKIYRKRTRNTRREVLIRTCEYFKATGRFKYV